MFSIIVPSFNRQQEILALLADLKQQTFQQFEVIIVDDCSEQAVKIEEDYPFHTQLIRNPHNQGAAASRNIGVNQAAYDWLLFLDDDDRFAADKCEKLAEVIRQNPQINFIYHPAKCEMVNEGFSYETHPFKNIADINLENLLKANKIGGMPMIAMKKDLFLKTGGLSTALRSLEDYDFLLKLVQCDDFRPFYLDNALTFCTFHTQRVSVSTDNSNTQKALDYIQQHYVNTPLQQAAFAVNREYISAYPKIMNLSRSAAKHYFNIFKFTKNSKMLILAAIIFISPKLAIHLKRFSK